MLFRRGQEIFAGKRVRFLGEKVFFCLVILGREDAAAGAVREKVKELQREPDSERELWRRKRKSRESFSERRGIS